MTVTVYRGSMDKNEVLDGVTVHTFPTISAVVLNPTGGSAVSVEHFQRLWDDDTLEVPTLEIGIVDPDDQNPEITGQAYEVFSYLDGVDIHDTIIDDGKPLGVQLLAFWGSAFRNDADISILIVPSQWEFPRHY